MRITGTAVKLVVFWSVLAMFTVMIIVVFGQVRFDRTTGYSAVFTDAAGYGPGSSCAPPGWRWARSPP